MRIAMLMIKNIPYARMIVLIFAFNKHQIVDYVKNK